MSAAMACFGPLAPGRPPLASGLRLRSPRSRHSRARVAAAAAAAGVGVTAGTRQRTLSSTYRSFQEEEDDLISVTESAREDEESVFEFEKERSGSKLGLLSRSRSEGNLSAGGRAISRCLKALSGSWKNLLQLGGMSRPPKPAVVKKVAPPSVPDAFRHSGSSFGSGYSSSEDGYLSQPPGDPPPLLIHPGTLAPGVAPGPRAPGQGDPQPPCDHSDVYGMSGKSGGQFSYPAFTFPGPQGLQYTQLVHAGKAAAYYHPHPPAHLQEDQGIDMTQSPGRDSPGSSGSGSTSSGCGGGGGGGRSSGSAGGSGGGGTGGGGGVGGGGVGGGGVGGGGCRHSTASLDSGRASSGFIPASSSSSSSSGGGSGGGSGGSGGSAGGSSSGGGSHARCSLDSSPRCSLSSSSSIASSSADHHHAALFGCGCGAGGAAHRVERLMQQGVPDQDIIQSWLMDLHFEEYFPLFASAGYDMPTISRMTPEDLTAIGIKKPNHRKKLKAEIALLNISDGLPEYIPSSIEEWLGLLGLSEYAGALRQQGCRTVEDVASGVTWEDLEDIGIIRLGHQKKILLAIKRVKDIKAGKRFPQPQPLPSADHPISLHLMPPHMQSHLMQQQQMQQHMNQPQEVMITTGGHSPVHECYPASTAPSSFHTFHRASVHHPPPSSPQPHHQVHLHRGGSTGYQVRWSRDGIVGVGGEDGPEEEDDGVVGDGEEGEPDDEDGEEYQTRHRRIQQFLQSSQLPPPGSPSHHSNSPNTSSAFSPFYFSRPPPPPAPSMCYQPSAYCPDIVPIKIRGGRGKSLESLEDGSTATSHLTFGGGGSGGVSFQHQPQIPQLHLPQMHHSMHSHPFYPQPHIHHPHLHYFRGTAVAPLPGWRPRSYDDGDITPTNEGHLQSLLLHHHLHHHSTAFTEGGGTLPRPRSSSATSGGPASLPFSTLKPRPVAKISACTQNTVRFKGEEGEAEDDEDDDEEEENVVEGEEGKEGQKKKERKKKNLELMAEFEKQSLQMPPPMPLHACAYKSLPRDLAERERYFAMAGLRKVPPSPPKRNPPPQSTGAPMRSGEGETPSHGTGEGDMDRRTSPPLSTSSSDATSTASPMMERQQRVTFHQSTLSSGSEGLSTSGMPSRSAGSSSPPGPAPSSGPPRWDGSSSMPDFSEQEGMMGIPGNGGILGMHQNRNGSDASFKSSSSTESDSLPFANENAGTIKQRATRPHPTLSSAMDYPKQEYVPPKRVQQPPQESNQMQFRERMGMNSGNNSELGVPNNPMTSGVNNVECSSSGQGQEPADVLNDIGNMLANLTDELDAMLEEEKRQGLSQ